MISTKEVFSMAENILSPDLTNAVVDLLKPNDELKVRDNAVVEIPNNADHPLKQIPEVKETEVVKPQGNVELARILKENADIKDELAKRRISERTATERLQALENEKILNSMDREQRLEFLAQEAVNKTTGLERELSLERTKTKVMNYVTNIGIKNPLTIAELLAPSLVDKVDLTDADIELKVGGLVNSLQTEKPVYNIGNGIKNPETPNPSPLKDIIKFDEDYISDQAKAMAERGQHDKALLQRVGDLFKPFSNKGG